jgi:hypothetical protein
VFFDRRRISVAICDPRKVDLAHSRECRFSDGNGRIDRLPAAPRGNVLIALPEGQLGRGEQRLDDVRRRAGRGPFQDALGQAPTLPHPTDVLPPPSECRHLAEGGVRVSVDQPLERRDALVGVGRIQGITSTLPRARPSST